MELVPSDIQPFMLKHSDLLFVVDRARAKYLEIPIPSKLPGMLMDLSERDMVALSYIEASLALLVKNNIIKYSDELNELTQTFISDSDCTLDDV